MMSQEYPVPVSGESSFQPIDSSCRDDQSPPPDSDTPNIIREDGDRRPHTVDTSLVSTYMFNPTKPEQLDDDSRLPRLYAEGDSGCVALTPYPYAPSSQELEDRQQLTKQLGSDWSISDAVTLCDDDDDVRENGKDESSLPVKNDEFEFFFENLPPTDDVPEAHDDDISFIYDDVTIVEPDDDVSMSDPITKSIWEENSVVPSDVVLLNKRSPSPAQISVGSGKEDDEPLS